MARKVTAPERSISSMIGRTLASCRAFAARCDALAASLAFRQPWITQDHSAGLCGSQRVFCAPRDHRALLFGKCRIQVQHERIDVGAELGNDERDTLRHEAGDEMNVTR